LTAFDVSQDLGPMFFANLLLSFASVITFVFLPDLLARRHKRDELASEGKKNRKFWRRFFTAIIVGSICGTIFLAMVYSSDSATLIIVWGVPPAVITNWVMRKMYPTLQ
jgi:hypothetical protein